MTLRIRHLAAVGVAVVVASCAQSTPETSDQTSDTRRAEPAQITIDPNESPAMITLESWQFNSKSAWIDDVIPAFENDVPGVDADYLPTRSADYNNDVAERLADGIGSDIIACRPFDWSLKQFQNGHFVDLTELLNERGVPAESRRAFSTDDQKHTYCVPIASVMHGIYYNKQLFSDLGLDMPTTIDEFIAQLATVAGDGRYIPLAAGAAEIDAVATTLMTTLGAPMYGGDTGRLGLIDGTQKVTDRNFVAALEVIERVRPFVPDAVEEFEYLDMKRLFTNGEAVFLPGGSWEIASLQDAATFDIGLVPPLRATSDSPCVVTDHPDIGIAVNAASKQGEQAMSFAEWATSGAFYDAFTEQLIGFFPLSKASSPQANELMSELAAFRNECERTPRLADQILSRGNPVFIDDYNTLTTKIMIGQIDAAGAASELQRGLEGWYEPQRP